MIKQPVFVRLFWITLVTYFVLVVTTVTKSYDRYLLSDQLFIAEAKSIWTFVESASILWALFLVFIPFISFSIKRFRFNDFDLKKLSTYAVFFTHITISLIVTFLHAILYVYIIGHLRNYNIKMLEYDIFKIINSNMTYYTIIDIFIYVSILVSYYLVKYYEEIRITQMRSLDLESQLSIVRLEALKMQIQPHFVFNALHNINALLHENVEAAKTNLIRLKVLMQRSYENLDRQLISLDEELQFIEAYLGVEQTRFADRLKVFYEISDEAKQAVVPSMILQPVVENAIKHGISKNITFGIIKIQAEKIDKKLILSVSDNGPGMKQSNSSPKFGIGIMNTMNRLEILFDHHEFNMNPSKLGGVEVVISLPYIES